MGGTSIYAQVLSEVKEMRSDVHAIDKKLEVHLAHDEEWCKQMDSLNKIVRGNGVKGLVTLVEDLVDDKKSRDEVKTTEQKAKIDLKTGAILAGVSAAIGVLAELLLSQLM